MSIYELVSTLVVVAAVTAAVVIVEFASVEFVPKYGTKVFKEY